MRYLLYFLLLWASLADAQPSITRMEYFIGSDPGFGAATPVTGISAGPDINGLIYSISGSLDLGINYVGFRSRDTNNVWSHTNFLTLNVVDGTPSEIAEIEYFWDVDLGFNNNPDTVLIDPISDIFNGTLYANVPINVGLGPHILFVRSRDTKGRWSLTNLVDSVVVAGTVNMADEPIGSHLSVYPNPFTEGITVRTDDGQPVRVILYDPQGKLIYDEVLRNETHIDLHQYASGSYTAFFWKELKRIHRVQLVKQ